MKIKTVITSCLVLVLINGFFTFSKGSVENKVLFTLKPREIHLLEIKDDGTLEDKNPSRIEFSANTKKAIDRSPLWLQTELKNQFEALDYRPVYTSQGSTPTTGDIDGDGDSDIIIGSNQGTLQVLNNQHISQTISLDFAETIEFLSWKEKEINPSLLDMNKDGLADLLIGAGNQLYLLQNKSSKSSLSFSEPELIFTHPVIEENLCPCGFLLEESLVIILGHRDGSLGLLRKQENKWTEDTDFFRNWKEKWQEEGEDPKGVFVTSDASPSLYKTPQNNYLLVIGSGDGSVKTFLLTIASGTPIIQTYPLLEKLETTANLSPTFVDIDNNNRMDIAFCSKDEPFSYLLNEGTNESIHFQLLDSQGEKNPINDFFGGSGYYRDFNSVYATGYHESVTDTIANFLLSVDVLYLDEVAYCIAHMQTEDLVAYVNTNTLSLLLENAKGIYDMAEKVNYVKIKERTESTTLIYNTDKGWKEMPQDIYYPYLVMLNRYLMAPTNYEKLYQKNFFRTYLPFDKTYEKTLFDRVKEAKTLYEAAYQVMYFFKMDVGGVWHTGEKPRGWYNIYHNMLNKEVGIWCGEWSIIYEACARAMNIPTIIIVAMGEDHQFNNFWADSWHHVDPSAGESKVVDGWATYFDDSLAYYKHWGKRIFSWPMEWEGNGKYDHVWRSELPYNPEEILSDVTFQVTDLDGKPIDGARVELWSHWPMEGKYQPIPFISAIGYTDVNGKATIIKVGHQKFTVVVVSRIGSTQFFLSLSKPGNVNYPVTIASKTPDLYPFRSIRQSNVDLAKAIKRWTINPGNPDQGEPYVDASTLQTFIPAREFADFIDATIQWDGKKHQLTLTKEKLRVTFQEKSTLILVNGEERRMSKTPFLLKKGRSFLDLQSLVSLFDLTSETDPIHQKTTLIYAMIKSRTYQVILGSFVQDNFPMIDVYSTILRYREFWKQKTGSAEVYLLSETELKKMQAGTPMEKGDMVKLSSSHDLTFQVPSYNPTNEKYYLVFWNPNFATQTKVSIHRR